MIVVFRKCFVVFVIIIRGNYAQLRCIECVLINFLDECVYDKFSQIRHKSDFISWSTYLFRRTCHEHTHSINFHQEQFFFCRELSLSQFYIIFNFHTSHTHTKIILDFFLYVAAHSRYRIWVVYCSGICSVVW